MVPHLLAHARRYTHAANTRLELSTSPRMNWEENYQNGEVFWDRGTPSPPMADYLQRHPLRGRTLVPGCGHGHEVALASQHGLDATGLDIAPTGVAAARSLYPLLADRIIVGDLFDPAPELRGAFDVVGAIAADVDGGHHATARGTGQILDVALDVSPRRCEHHVSHAGKAFYSFFFFFS